MHNVASSLVACNPLMDDLVVLINPTDCEAAIVVAAQPYQKEACVKVYLMSEEENGTRKDPEGAWREKCSYNHERQGKLPFLFSFDELRRDSASLRPISP